MDFVGVKKFVRLAVCRRQLNRVEMDAIQEERRSWLEIYRDLEMRAGI